MDILSIYDILLGPLYLLVVLFLASMYQKKKVFENEEYKYFVWGLCAKIAGAMALGAVYTFIYNGGDTVNYFTTAKAYINLIDKDWDNFLWGWLGETGPADYSFFDSETGYPVYWHKDHHSFFVARLEIPIILLGATTYFPSAILTAVLCYSGTWKLYRVFITEFPDLKKKLAIFILFIPSVVFWGSGIMKDSFTLAAVGWYTYGFYMFFIRKKRNPYYLICLFIASFIILSIKPYIFFAILPGSIIWLSNQYAHRINNKTLKLFFTPFLIAIGIGSAVFALQNMSDYLGLYKMDTVLERAAIVQKDMKAEYYHGNSFDIGDFDASASGAAAKAPIAVFSGLFRPTLLDVRNPFMLISALENTFVLFLTIFLLIKVRISGLVKYVRMNPLLLFSFLFSLFFAFAVGLSVANFGSLVRLRIPGFQFFVPVVVVLRHFYDVNKSTTPKVKERVRVRPGYR
jgi:hypothetical protein